MRTVLVMDGEQRAALTIVRSLGRAGHKVYVCSSEDEPLCGASRHVQTTALVANGLVNPTQLANQVLALIAEHGIDTLIPVSEASLLAMLPYRSSIPDVCIPFPDFAAFQRICDKPTVLEEAQRIGMAIPAQTLLPDPEAARTLPAERLTYPLVIKPARSVSGTLGNRAKFSVQYAENAEELRSILADADSRAYPLLLQQRILGPGIGIFLLLWDDRVMATFAHRRLREHPPSGGVSVYCESVAMNDALLEQSVRLLQAFKWRGVAMVECKVDERTGTPYLMEVNGRFWGSLQLAIEAGVDFPNLLLSAALGELDTPVTTYTVGTRNRWFWGEVNHVVTRLRRSNRDLALPPGTPSRRQMLREFFQYSHLDHFETVQTDDMQPFWRETIQWFKSLSRSRK